MSYTYVTDITELRSCINFLSQHKRLAFDTETCTRADHRNKIVDPKTKEDKGGLDPHVGEIRLFQFKVENYAPILIDRFKLGNAIELLQNLFNSESTIYIGHNLKFDLQMLWGCGFELYGSLFDTMLASQCLNAGKDLTSALGLPENKKKSTFSLKSTLKYYLGISLTKEQQVSNWSLSELSEEQLTYAALDVEYLFKLREILVKELIANNIKDVAKLEFDTIFATADMEYNGITLDTAKWKSLAPIYEDRRDKAKDSVLKELPYIAYQSDIYGNKSPLINLSSPIQVLRQLQALGTLDPELKDESGNPLLLQSTSKKTLKLLDDSEVVDTFLAYKQAEKRLTGFVYTLADLVHPVTGRIHPSFNQYGADTGRYSCNSPNLQQMPKTEDFRECFISPSEDTVLIIADFSQIEVRIVAEITEDENLLDVYLNDRDIYKATASKFANKQECDVTKEERFEAKALVLGLNYCLGDKGFRRYSRINYGVRLTQKEATYRRRRYFEIYPGIKRWHESIDGKQTKAVNINGRFRVWDEPPGISALSNFPVQSLSADITKVSLADCYFYFRRRFGSHVVKLLATVHDEVVAESPKSIAEEVAAYLKYSMEEAGSRYLKICPVKVEPTIGTSWAEK